MNINITLFFQVFNFLITYWFLNKFLFKPVLLFIKNKSFKKNEMLKSIEKKEYNLLHLQEEKHSNLFDFKQKIKDKYSVDKGQEAHVPELARVDLDSKVVDETLKEVKTLLIDRVPHVD